MLTRASESERAIAPAASLPMATGLSPTYCGEVGHGDRESGGPSAPRGMPPPRCAGDDLEEAPLLFLTPYLAQESRASTRKENGVEANPVTSPRLLLSPAKESHLGSRSVGTPDGAALRTEGLSYGHRLSGRRIHSSRRNSPYTCSATASSAITRARRLAIRPRTWWVSFA